MAGFRLTTKIQVSGWRFLLRRLEHAIVRRDTRMFDDPLSFYSRSAGAGIIVAVLILVGCLALAYFKPQGKLDGNLFVDNATKQLFVLVGDRIRPVYNLTSARLVLGKPDQPASVRSSELDKLPRGQSIGIPGAPHATPVSPDSSPNWALCDTVNAVDSPNPSVQTSVISMPLVIGADDPFHPQGVLMTTYQDQTWVITPNGRHATDLGDRALTLALGIPQNTRPSPLSDAMFNAIPDAGPWKLPPIPGAGGPNTLGLPAELVIGSVFQIDSGFGNQSFVVLPDGVAAVNANTASLLRARESYGLVTMPSIVKSEVAKIPERQYPSPLPDEAVKLVSRQEEPVLCWTWQRVAGEQAPRTAMLSLPHLPIPPSAMDKGISQVRGTVTVYLDGGRYLQIQSPDPRYGESLYYVDPQGVRYGVPDQATAQTLGLTTPTTAPWWAVRLLVEGPVLSRQAALLEHDTLPADPNPRKLPAPAGASG
jgi:type VII secretion protein EccB